MELELTRDKVMRVVNNGLENYSQAEIEDLFSDLNTLYIWGTFDDFYYKYNALIIEYCFENFRISEGIINVSYSDNYSLVYEYIIRGLDGSNDKIINFILDFMWLLARQYEADFDRYAFSLVEKLLTCKLSVVEIFSLLQYDYHGLGNVDALIINYAIENGLLRQLMDILFNINDNSKVMRVVRLLPDNNDYAHYKLGINI